jgi:predicted DNA-binding transcriptional regulator AlpA
MTQTDQLLTPPEAAALLRVAERTLADWRYRGVGPRHIRYSGRALRYRLSDVDAWLESRARTSTADQDAGR